MAYSTGNVLSLDETYDALISFMTANGWTLHDNIPITGSRDKVLRSNGSDGKLSMHYRISTNTFGNFLKGPDDVHVKMPHILVRGYHNWNATTHSGTGEYGIWGPLMWGGERFAVDQQVIIPIEKPDGTPVLNVTPTFYLYYNLNSQPTANLTTDLDAVTFDGRRKMWCGTTGGDLAYLDFISCETKTYTIGTGDLQTWGVALVKDLNTDKETAFVMSRINSAFFKVDVDTGVVTSLTLPPWGAAGGGGAYALWDGGDFIYYARGAVTTQWARYSISQNNWGAGLLASMPVTMITHNETVPACPQRMVYVPNSVTGIGEDVVYALIADTGTVIYRYDVTSNVWRSTAGTGALTAPATITANAVLVWDRARYLHYFLPGSGATIPNCWRSDLSTAPNTFTSMGAVMNSNSNIIGVWVLNHVTAKLRSSDVIPGKYFFHGDANSIRAVFRVGTNAGNGRYYWMYLGKYDTTYRPQIMGVTATVTPGVRTVVNVDSTTGFNDGQTITMVNWSGSYFERTNIYQISGSNAFTCNLTGSFPSGSKVGLDPSQNILTGDCGIGIAPMSQAGYRVGNEPDWYNVYPEVLPADMSAGHGLSNARDAFVPVRYVIRNRHLTVRGDLQETLGRLYNVFSLPKDVFPGPQNEDILVFGGEQYIYFNQQEVATNTVDNRGIVIGPI